MSGEKIIFLSDILPNSGVLGGWGEGAIFIFRNLGNIKGNLARIYNHDFMQSWIVVFWAEARKPGSWLTIVWVSVIPDKPRCVDPGVVVVAVSQTSWTNLIPCDTKGLPEATSYRWALNTSAGISQISGQNSSSLKVTRDQLGFSHLRRQLGEVKCWASNSLGESKHPCVFHLVTAGQGASILDGYWF